MMRKMKVPRLTLKYLARLYKTEYKNTPLDVPLDVYRKVNEDFNKYLVNYLVATGNIFEMPGGGGTLYIRKRKSAEDNFKYNFGVFRKTGKLLEYTNPHSFGYYGRFKWSKSKVYLPNKTLYRFRACDYAKNTVSYFIINFNTIHKYFSK